MSDFYEQMDYKGQSNSFQVEEEKFSKCGQSLAFIKHEVMLLMNFL